MSQPNNQQPIEKKIHHPEGFLEVHHIFSTIQGEGPFAGKPAVFIRLAGCNLQCSLCDTDYTSSRFLASPQTILELVEEQTGPAHFVVITGGEPFRQNLTPTVELLLDEGFKVQIETNGTLYDPDFPYYSTTIVCSPKAGKIHPSLMTKLDALKYVLHADQVHTDGLPTQALNHIAKPVVGRPDKNFHGTIYLQPVDVDDPVENERHLKAAIKSCQRFGYTLCLQLHKLVGLE